MLWGGRFKDKLNEDALNFSSSIGFDINLIEEDIFVSKVHSEMLARVRLITEDDFVQIQNGLDQILNEWKERKWKPDQNDFEDVHSAVESRLTELIGKTAGKLHTGRSRNDQVATDMKLWVRKSVNLLLDALQETQKIFIEKSEDNIETIIPGYTHLQRAQPISFAFHLLAYVEMFEADKNRLRNILTEIEGCPLGSGALAGSTLPLDRDFAAKKLGFKYPTPNALNTVSNRDYLLDFLNTSSIGMMHLSRLAEEIILWSSSEWKLILLSDQFTTGSSLMPQKKNPDLAELTRGKTGRVFGNQFALLTTIKGLPLSYNRDLQEDKEPVFDSYKTYITSLKMVAAMIDSAKINKERFVNELAGDFLLATDLADWLVLHNIPFREAHEIVGSLIKCAEEKSIKLDKLSLEEMKKVNPVFDETAKECFNIKTSLQRKKTYGSPNPDFVKEQINIWKTRLD
ncbi:MAG: argininosuccinate lyase [Ignavibacteriaceae bacterium]